MSEISGLSPNPMLRPLTGPRAAAAPASSEPLAPLASFGQDANEVDFSAAGSQGSTQGLPDGDPSQDRWGRELDPETGEPVQGGRHGQETGRGPDDTWTPFYDSLSGSVRFQQAELRSRPEEYDGFLVAGAGGGAPSLASAAQLPQASAAGPIALIDEPLHVDLPAFPDLDLNGPSSLATGLFSLGGLRLA